MFGLITGILFLILARVLVAAICCSGVFDFLEQTCSWNVPKRLEHRTKSAAGEAKLGPRGYPPEVSKHRLQAKTTLPQESAKQLAPKWEPASETFMMFRCFYASLLMFKHGCSIIWEPILASFL